MSLRIENSWQLKSLINVIIINILTITYFTDTYSISYKGLLSFCVKFFNQFSTFSLSLQYSIQRIYCLVKFSWVYRTLNFSLKTFIIHLNLPEIIYT